VTASPSSCEHHIVGLLKAALGIFAIRHSRQKPSADQLRRQIRQQPLMAGGAIIRTGESDAP
jgi:uncharacterized membrane protein